MRFRLVVVGLVVVAGAAGVGAALAGRDGGSTPVSANTATIGRPTTATRARPTTTALAVTTTTAVPRATAAGVVAEPSVGEEPPGVVITNSGSATASVGGNVVAGGSPGTVVTGDATAVGNSSTVRTP